MTIRKIDIRHFLFGVVAVVSAAPSVAASLRAV
jgi:hypothetical protein